MIEKVKKFIPLIFVLIFNLWIWRIFSINILVGIVTLVATIALWLSAIYKKDIFLIVCIVTFIALIFFQWKTSSKNSLTFLNENEKMLLLERLRAYPPVSISLGNKKIWIPIANWLEQRKEILVFYKLRANFSEVIDPNLYFYANHPRERIGVIEYEKFPYILLPIFIVGLFSFKRWNVKSLALGISPLVLSSIIGNSNPMGPFALFPFFAVSLALGMTVSVPFLIKRRLIIPALILFILVFVQTLAYAKY